MKKIMLFLVLLLLMGCDKKIDNTSLEPEPSVPPLVVEEIKVDKIPDIPHIEILFSSERGGDRDLYMTSLVDEAPLLILDLPSIEGHGDWHPDGYHIAFFSDMDGDRDIYTIDIRDFPILPVQLTDAPGMDHLPDWSPDGEHIVFESNRHGNGEIYIMKADGSQEIRLTASKADNRAPKFSPDGKTIGFTTFIDGLPYFSTMPYDPDLPYETPQAYTTSKFTAGYMDWSMDKSSILCHDQDKTRTSIYKIDLKDEHRERIAFEDAKSLWVPVYDTSNQWMAYCTETSFGTGEIFLKSMTDDTTFQVTHHPSSDWGPDIRPQPKDYLLLYDSDIDGDREIYLLNTETKEKIQLTDNNYEDGLPDWSPDGQSIVFFSNRDGDDEIYTMSADGSNVKQLTFNDCEDRTPAWSHDGQRIAYASMIKGNYDIFIMDIDGKNSQQLTNSATKEFWPTWGPHDDKILYTHFGNTQDTYTIDLRENNAIELFEENCSRASYSPDGKRLAFSRFTAGHWDIYQMFADGSRPLPLTSSKSNEWVPTWAYDNKTLVFSREKDYAASIISVNTETYEIKGILPNKGQNWRPIYKPIF